MIIIKISRFCRKTLSGALKFYHNNISSFFPNTCRFTPTCSVYMAMAIEQKGVFKGFWIGLKRLLKCHPFHPGGYDPFQ